MGPGRKILDHALHTEGSEDSGEPQPHGKTSIPASVPAGIESKREEEFTKDGINRFFAPPPCSSSGGTHPPTDPQVLHLPLPRHGQHSQTKVGRHGVHGGRGGPKRHLRAEKVRILQKQRHHLLHR